MTRAMLSVGIVLLASAGCGRVQDIGDASSDAGGDAKPDGYCIPTGQPESDGPPFCCSHASSNDICIEHCSRHGTGCDLPNSPCCADAGVCTAVRCE